jgi:hypothetical protein
MSTQVISQEQEMKWSAAIQQFSNEVYAKYPSLGNSWTPALIEEVKAIGLFKEFISPRSLWACFRNACADGRIVLPPIEAVLTPEVIEKIRNSFPPVVKQRELTQREKNAASGVERNNGRKNHAEKEEPCQTGMSHAMDAVRLTKLKAEYKTRLSEAESAVGDNPRNHAETYRLRKSLKDALAADRRFDPVRD